MQYDPNTQLIYIDLALRDGHITDEEWLEMRGEWLVYLDELEDASRENW